MAITQTNTPEFLNKPRHKWETVTESDTPAAVAVPGGRYSCVVIGGDGNGDTDFGSGTIEFQFSPDNSAGSYHSLDAAALTFSAQGTENIEIPRGYILPVRTGGSSMDVDVFLIPIPSDAA